MYIKPDFVKVELKIEDNFTGYGVCPMDLNFDNMYVVGTCTAPDGERMVDLTSYWYQCYHSDEPPASYP